MVMVVAGLVLLPSPLGAEAAGFPDVSSSMPSYDAIQFLTGADVISGFPDGTFKPADTLKRGQATKVLVLWKGLTPSNSGPTFTDLDSIYSAYVRTAATQGWITGYEDGTFRPYSTLSRQQMAIIMVRAMGWDADAGKLSSSQIASVLAAFTDEPDIASVARPYVALAVQRGLFGGIGDGRFDPKSGITRAQFCMVVFRAELSLLSVPQAIRFAGDYEDKTRVVVDLSRKPGTVTAAVSADGLLTVDYTGGGVAGVVSQACGTPEVDSVAIRQLKYDPRTVRVTVDLARYQRFRVMSLAPSDGKGYRIVIDVYRRLTGPLGAGPPLICVDPGHGGEDSGAIGITGTLEKDLNLAISLLLAEDLKAAGLKVIMTREDDSYPTLQGRADMANEALANLFVSIHNNAAGDPDANGTETFYWGTPDNYSVEGKLLAEAIQRNLLAEIGSIDRGARTHWRNLVVLAETCMPAALAEVGFVTNAAEEAKLKTPEYQQAAALGVAKGVLEYLKWSTTVYTTES